MIYFVTVNYYSTELIANLLDSIVPIATAPYRMVVVNNSVDDVTIEALKQPNVQIIHAEKNLGYGMACNLGLSWVYEQDPNAIVWIINPDTCLLNHALNAVQEFVNQYPELSIVGTLVYDSTGRIWFAGGQFIPAIGEIKAIHEIAIDSTSDYQITDWITGCSLLINLSNFKTCPYFSSEYFLYYEDFDFCRRYATQGHAIAITPRVEVMHHASAITSRNSYQKSKHSTYSYLLTLNKYAPHVILWLRLMRVLFHVLLVMPLRPRKAMGTLHGVLNYLTR